MRLASDKLQEQQGRLFLGFKCSALELEYLHTNPFQNALLDLCECKSGFRLSLPILLTHDEVFIVVGDNFHKRMDNEFINFVLLCLREKGFISSNEANQIHSQVEGILGKLSPLEKILPWMQSDCSDLFKERGQVTLRP